MTQTKSRRSFIVTLGHALLLAQFAPRVLADTAAQFSPEIADLYRKSIVIDTLCSPFTNDDVPPEPALLAVVRRSGITAINFTDFSPNVRRNDRQPRLCGSAGRAVA